MEALEERPDSANVVGMAGVKKDVVVKIRNCALQFGITSSMTFTDPTGAWVGVNKAVSKTVACGPESGSNKTPNLTQKQNFPERVHSFHYERKEHSQGT